METGILTYAKDGSNYLRRDLNGLKSPPTQRVKLITPILATRRPCRYTAAVSLVPVTRGTAAMSVACTSV